VLATMADYAFRVHTQLQNQPTPNQLISKSF
jgi:hypothetical protein